MELQNFNQHIVIDNRFVDIDFDSHSLVENGNVYNFLSLDRNLVHEGHYHIWFNYQGRLEQVHAASNENASVIPVGVFERGHVDNFIMADSINIQSIKNNMRFLLLDRPIFERLKGKLPLLHIGEDVFTYDTAGGLLIPKDGESDPIPIEEFVPIDFGDQTGPVDLEILQGFYHLSTRQLLSENFQIKGAWPKGTILIEIPGPITADPIGVARKDGFPDTYYLNSGLKLQDYHARLIYLGMGISEQNLWKSKKLQTGLENRIRKKQGL